MKSPRALVRAAFTAPGLTVAALVAVAAFMRLIPHPANFLPISAMALFAGARCGNRSQALLLIAAAMLLSDAILGFHPTMFFVYCSLALTVVLGSVLKERESVATIGASALAGSFLFFLVTNFGVWLVDGMYPLTGAGLFASYVAAIPFFENSLVADLLYTALLFGAYELLTRRQSAAQFAA